MPDRRTAVREAHAIYKRRDKFDAKKRDEAIALLQSHGVWSHHQISKITGATLWFVRRTADSKTDKTGGRLNPETLSDIERIIRLKDKGEIDRTLMRSVVERGTSVYVLADLIGMPVSTMKRLSAPTEAAA